MTSKNESLPDLQTFKCYWRTVSDFQPAASGELTVKAKDMAHAIDVAKQRIYEQRNLGTKHVVVYEIEEPFL